MKAKVHFGPAGNSQSFYREGHKSSLEMPAWLHEKGLDAYEYQCTYGVRLSEKTARRLGEAARERGILLSLHAPYYINLATKDKNVACKTTEHILKSLNAAKLMGAKVVVFHPGSAGGNREDALERAKNMLTEILHKVESEGFAGIKLAPETAGKRNQLGTVEEVISLCELGAMLVPTLDFGHLHAVTGGGMTEKKDFAGVLDKVFEKLVLKQDKSASSNVSLIHVHFSPVEFTGAGEKKHWTTLDEGFGPDFAPLAELLVEREISTTVICESAGRQAEDALIYKEIYDKANEKFK